MKKVFFCAALLVSSFVMKAQQIQLEEAKVLFTPQVIMVKGDHRSSTYEVKVKEASTGNFHRDPIAFMRRNLDMNHLMGEFEENNELFSVTFKSKKGRLVANFNEKGELLNTSQKFRNIILPRDLREDLYRNYKGWTMVSNKYEAKGSSTSVEKQEYHVKLKKGKLTKNISLKKEDQEYALAMK